MPENKPEYKVELLIPAWNELDEISDFHLAMVGPISAKKITDKIFKSLERLETFPLSCPYVPDRQLKEQGYRMLVCGKYVCIYRLIGKVVYVYHIANGSMEYSKLIKTDEDHN